MKKGIICAIVALMVVLSMAGGVAAATTISFDPNGGTGGQTTTVEATSGSQMPALTSPSAPPTKAGFTFAGYYDAQFGGTQYYTAAGVSARNWDKADATYTLYAHWDGVTEVKYTVAESYTWSAPPEIIVGVGEGNAGTGDIEVTAINIPNDKKLVISAPFTGLLTLKGGTATHSYNLKLDETAVTTVGGVIAEFAYDVSVSPTPAKKTLKAYVTEAPTTAGDWTDTLTFTAALDNA